MSLFNHKNSKRSRSSRAAAIGASSTVAGQIDEALHNRSLILRMFLCLVALIALLVAVEGWKTPFIYRLGDHAVQGILAKVDFSKFSRSKTDQAIRDAVRQVPLFFRNGPEPLQALPLSLRADLEEVVEAETMEELSDETRRRFGLIPTEKPGPNDVAEVSDPQERFAALRSVFSGNTHTPPVVIATGSHTPDAEVIVSDVAVEDRIGPFIDTFTTLIQPLQRLGVAGPLEQLQIADENDGAIDKIRPEQPIAVFQTDDAKLHITATLLEVLPNEILKESDLPEVFRLRYLEKLGLLQIAEVFGVSEGALWHIFNGKTWTHATQELLEQYGITQPSQV